MATVDVDGNCQFSGGITAQVDWLGLRVGGHPALSLHSSDEPGDDFGHDDSTINAVVVIIIVITINTLLL